MVQRIEIEGDLVRVINVDVITQAALTDILPHIENRPPITMFKPRSAIFTHWDESNPSNKIVKFLCELAPGTRAIVKNNRRYRIALPWTYFVFSFSTSRDINQGASWSIIDYFVFHSRDRVTGLDSRLWSAFLPNVYSDGRICFGSTGPDTNQPLADRVDQLVNNWYLTQFNNDVHGTRQHPLPYRGRLPNGWALWVNATNERGASSYLDWPEWEMTNGEEGVESFTVREVLGIQDENTARTSNHGDNIRINPDRVTSPTVRDAIPEIISPMTFGRAEEWLRTITPVDRFRLNVALQNMVADDPATLQEPEEPIEEPLDHDGGEPVTE